MVIVACNNNDGDLSLGKEFVENTTDIIQVDTFTVELSTVAVDSIVTSSTETILVGCYDDGDLGKITSKSYFLFALPGSFDVEDNDIFDSLTLVMPYSSYYYGDTNVINQIDVYRLSEELARSDVNYYYNTSEVDHESLPIGQKYYLPRPNKDSILEIRISDLLGLDILEKIKENAEEVSSSDLFQNYLYGLVVAPPEAEESSAIIGFKNDSLELKLYTSRIEEDKEEITHEFKSASVAYQFNQITSDRSGTLLENLILQTDDISSSETENKAYVQAGTGVLMKVMFPYLNTLIFDDNDLILSVELIIKPADESYEGNFPESLELYISNQKNDVLGELQDANGNLVSSTFGFDELYHLNTYYSFDITYYLNKKLKAGYIDNDQGILIGVSDYNTSLERLIASDKKDLERKPKLKITYLKN